MKRLFILLLQQRLLLDLIDLVKQKSGSGRPVTVALALGLRLDHVVGHGKAGVADLDPESLRWQRLQL